MLLVSYRFFYSLCPTFSAIPRSIQNLNDFAAFRSSVDGVDRRATYGESKLSSIFSKCPPVNRDGESNGRSGFTGDASEALPAKIECTGLRTVLLLKRLFGSSPTKGVLAFQPEAPLRRK